MDCNCPCCLRGAFGDTCGNPGCWYGVALIRFFLVEKVGWNQGFRDSWNKKGIDCQCKVGDSSSGAIFETRRRLKMFSIMIPTVSSHQWLVYWRGTSCFRCVSFASRLGPFSIEWYRIYIYIYSLLGEVSWVGWSELDETHLLDSKSISFGKDPYSSLLALLIPVILLHDKISSVIIVSSLSLTKSWVQLHGVGPHSSVSNIS